MPPIVEIRSDIYPDFRRPEADRLIDFWINLVYQAFSGLFDSKDALIEYINRLDEIGYAEQFIGVGRLYYYAKYLHCPICGKRIETCPHCEKGLEIRSFFVLVIILSLMEKLSIGLSEYKPFDQWVSQGEIIRKYQERFDSDDLSNIQELIEEMKSEYYDAYGSKRSVTAFFSEFLSKEEKITFIQSIRFLKKVPDLPFRVQKTTDETTLEDVRKFDKEDRELQREISEVEDIRIFVEEKKIGDDFRALPVCFDEASYWKCYGKNYSEGGIGYCHYNFAKCPLLADDNIQLDESFMEVVKLVYEWRSQFAHGERVPPMQELKALGDVYNDEFIFVELTSSRLKEIFEKMVKRYFDRHIIE